MKTLYVVRHAKSSWENPGLNDHDRPLLKKGVVKTDKVSNYLKHHIKCPELLISSTALRAKSTAEIIGKALNYPPEKMILSKALYHADSDEILDIIYGIENNVNSVMIFGHNPGFTYFVNQFLSPTIDNLPTSGVVCIEFGTDEWEDINQSKFHVNFVMFPKMLN